MTASLAAVREIWADRVQARSHGDLLYLAYLAVLGLGVIVVPVLRLLGMGLSRPDVVPALLAGSAPQLASAIWLATAAGLVLLGAVRGPALVAPFLTATLASSALRRRTVLWRPFARALLVPVLASVTLAALVAVTLITAGAATSADAAWFVVAAAGSGLLLGVTWLLGQLLGSAARRVLAATLAAAAVLVAALPFPVLLGAAYPAGPGDGVVWAASLLVAGVAAVALGVPALDRLRVSVLAEQAARWESATTTATTGDLVAAAGAFRAIPTTGRHLRAVGPGSLPVLYARRDAVAWLRTPESSVVGALVALLAAAVLTGGMLLTGPLAWTAIGAGTLGMWSATGPFVDGIRHAVHTLGAPTLLGQSASTQALLHAIAPTLLLILLTGAGGVALALTADVIRDAASTLLVPVLLVPVLVAGRVRDAAKGPMPLKLATPMPTAQGDISLLPMLAWQCDAILLALAAGAILAAAAGTGPVWMAPAVVLLTCAMVLMARRRLRDLRE